MKNQVEVPYGLTADVFTVLGTVILHRPQKKAFREGLPLGGDDYAVSRFATLVQLKDDDGEVIAEGTAVCNPSDTFSEFLGARIALGRAIKEYEADIEAYYDDIDVVLPLTPISTQSDVDNAVAIIGDYFTEGLYG